MEKEIKIKKLGQLEAIQKRPGLYIGATDEPSVLLREILDNSLDEVFSTKICNFVTAEKQKNGFYVVSDNGRGFPIYLTEDGRTACEMASTETHAGGKFENNDEATNGLNGVGSKAVNALSDDYIIFSKITTDNKDKSIDAVKKASGRNLYYYISFKLGIKDSEGCDTKADLEKRFGFTFPDGQSTVTAFKPSAKFFDSTDADFPIKNIRYVKTICKEFNSKNVKILINGKEIKDEFTPYKFKFTTEIKSEKSFCKFLVSLEPVPTMNTIDKTGSVNSLTVNSGLHINYVSRAWGEALKKAYKLSHDYVDNGLKLNVIALSGMVDYASQTKERCTKLAGLKYEDVNKQLIKCFTKLISDNQKEFDIHVDRLNKYVESLQKLSGLKELKKNLDLDGSDSKVRCKIPDCVRDATSQNRSECELVVTEGASASGQLIKARDRKTQAVMPLRGVPKNAVGKSTEEILKNAEMNAIITALGCGVNEYFKLEKCRYGKIIIAADAD